MRLFKPNVPRMLAKKDLKGLMEALRDKDPQIGAQAATALGYMRDPLIATLHDPDPGLRMDAVFSLPNLLFLGENVAELLAEALKDAEGFVREAAAHGLAKIKDPRGIDYLVKVLTSEYSSYKVDAAEDLGKYGGPQAVKILIAAIYSDDPMTSYAGAKGLAKIKDPDSIEPLREALKDPKWDVRRAAATALEEITGEDHSAVWMTKSP